MSTNIGSLPPPFPNAAQSLSKLSGDAQLRERVERSSDSAPIKTDFPPEQVKAPVSSAESGSETNTATTKDAGTSVDVSV